MTMTREEVKAFLMGDENPVPHRRPDRDVLKSTADFVNHEKPILSAGAMNDLLADALGQYEEEQPIQNHRARALGWRIIPRSQP